MRPEVFKYKNEPYIKEEPTVALSGQEKRRLRRKQERKRKK